MALYITFQAVPSRFWEKLVSTFTEVQLKDGLLVALSPILALVLTGIISSKFKARLVFWRWKYPLPGHRAFSKLASTDPRVNIKILEQKLGEISMDPIEQNRLWFNIYKGQADKPTIKESHRSYLLARDLTSIAFIFAFLGFLGLILFGHKFNWALLYFVVMSGHYGILAVTARNLGNRFVCNVLCEYSADGNL